MNFNKILKSLFGDKSSRDMKLIQPLVEKVKAAYPEIEKLSNDELRAKSKEIQKQVQDAAKPFQEKIDAIKAKSKRLLSTSANRCSTRSTSSTKRCSTLWKRAQRRDAHRIQHRKGYRAPFRPE